MEEIRLIYYSNNDGSIEGVYFTRDFDMDADDCCPPKCKVSSDQKISMNTDAFPMEWNMEKRNL